MWRAEYKRESRELVKDVFNKYKTCRAKSLQGVQQYLAQSFDGDRVQGGNVKNIIEDRIIAKADADVFVEKVDDVLRKLPGLYKTLMINCFVREHSDIQNYMDLGLPRRTYYRCKGEAIRMFTDELIAKNISI